MRKRVAIALILALLEFLNVLPVRPVAATQITVAVNGRIVFFPDQGPIVDENCRTLVPVRFPAETLGSSVTWDQATQRVTIIQPAIDQLVATNLVLTLGSSTIMVNGQPRQMDTTPIAYNERTMVPIRFIAEYLGAQVEWYDASGTVHIFTQGQTQAQIQQIEQQIAQQLGVQVPSNSNRTIGPNDSMFVMETDIRAIGSSFSVISISSKDNKTCYRWVCTNYPGMNTFHTYDMHGKPVTDTLGTSAGINFGVCGSGYDTPVVAGMKLTYNIYDTSDKLVRTVDFQL